MNRTYFGILFIVIAAIFLIGVNYLGYNDELYKFMVIILLIAYFAGQYSMKFPKR